MNKALFLDRDGVMNVDIGHLHCLQDCVFIEKTFDIARQYLSEGYLIIVITNQAGIAKGLYSEQDYLNLREYMHDEYLKRGLKITAEYHCPHHPDYTGACNCRKPHPGMILQAAADWDIDLAQSVMIGDKASDEKAAVSAGVRYLSIDSVELE